MERKNFLKILMAIMISFGLLSSLYAQNNHTNLGLFNFKVKGVTGFCDSSISERWTGTAWKFKSAMVFTTNTAGFINGFKGYDSIKALNSLFDAMLTGNNKAYKENAYFSKKALGAKGNGLILVEYIIADTNSSGWTTNENTFIVADTTGKTFNPNERYIYTYDSKGVMLGNHKIAYDVKSKTWMEKDADSFTYNTKGLLSVDNIWNYNSSTKKFELQQRKSYTYNAKGRDSITLNEDYDKSTSSWKLSSRTINTDNAAGYRIISYNETHFGTTWVAAGVDSTFFNSGGYATTVHYNYDATSKKWVLISRDQCGAFVTVTKPAAPSNLTVVALKKTNDKKVLLSWTDNSNNEDGFIVMRSTDGTNYTAIDSTMANATSFTDTALVPNTKYYYKVSAWNNAGASAPSSAASTTTYTSISEISAEEHFSIYPNPSNGVCSLELISNEKSESTVLIMDMAGRLVYNSKIQVGTSSVKLDLGNLANGIYTVMLNGKSFNAIHKLIIAR
jgi:hypothetical protein